jgi:hypothetical protein
MSLTAIKGSAELFSRRQFLNLSGIMLLNTGLSSASFICTAAGKCYGRTLEATPVYRLASLVSPPIGHLWPDTIVEIHDRDEDWYRTWDGFVSRFSIQPMNTPLLGRSSEQPSIPFWAEVAAAIAPVRTWCAADAPPVTRIGHGGVARVIDHLPGEQNTIAWYRLDSGNGVPLGWTQSAYWRPTSADYHLIAAPTLLIDRSSQTVTAYSGGEPVLQASISLGTEIAAGKYALSGRQISGSAVYVPGQDKVLFGVPWRVQFGDGYEIAGAYWHNRFGKSMPGPVVQVTPMLAHWLYGWLGDEAIVSVV